MKLFLIVLTTVFASLSLLFNWSAKPLPQQNTALSKLSTASALSKQPIELGQVNWLRSLDSGLVVSKSTGKPLLILFQEVPGCSNCTQYGSGALSHPLIVEAIEDLFVPVCIYNNREGADRAALQRFNEPAWNNPVVRIVQHEGRDIVPRISNFRSVWQLVGGMTRALDLYGKEIPAYLNLLEEELLARESGTETATFSMYCFWTGEGTFGAIKGVIATQPGFQDGKEVVQVEYNPLVVKKSDLEAATKPGGVQACNKNDGFRTDREPKYYLAQTPWKYVPMSSLQACRANSLVGKSASPEVVLSPRQRALYQAIVQHSDKKWKNAIGEADLAGAWAAATKLL